MPSQTRGVSEVDSDAHDRAAARARQWLDLFETKTLRELETQRGEAGTWRVTLDVRARTITVTVPCETTGDSIELRVARVMHGDCMT